MLRKKIFPVLLNAAQDVSDTFQVYEKNHANEAMKSYSDAIGRIVLAIYDATRSILREYPDLRPPEIGIEAEFSLSCVSYRGTPLVTKWLYEWLYKVSPRVAEIRDRGELLGNLEPATRLERVTC